MAYKRKTHDENQLITNYGYGEEIECTYLDKEEAENDLNRYRDEKKSGYLPDLRYVRIKNKRIRNV